MKQGKRASWRQSLGYAAIMAGYTARFLHADIFFRAMAQARVDKSLDRTYSEAHAASISTIRMGR